MNKVIVITGPTATGKTELGVHLAKAIDAEIISADSMQIYKYMDIGTAKPTVTEMCAIPHHMISIVPPWEDYSVARYVRDAGVCVDDIFKRGKQPVIVGGSGLYIDSLIKGLVFSKRGDPKLRKELEDRYDQIGGDAMLLVLKKADKERAAKLHANDKKRIVRALEAVEASGKSLSEHDAASKTLPPRYESLKVALSFSDRALLYERINMRVDKMIESGLVDEVSSLLGKNVPRDCTSMQAIGYKEIADALYGVTNLSAAAEKIKMESRRYAKRQLTWLRKDDSVRWLTVDNKANAEHTARVSENNGSSPFYVESAYCVNKIMEWFCEAK